MSLRSLVEMLSSAWSPVGTNLALLLSAGRSTCLSAVCLIALLAGMAAGLKHSSLGTTIPKSVPEPILPQVNTRGGSGNYSALPAANQNWQTDFSAVMGLYRQSLESDLSKTWADYDGCRTRLGEAMPATRLAEKQYAAVLAEYQRVIPEMAAQTINLGFSTQ